MDSAGQSSSFPLPSLHEELASAAESALASVGFVYDEPSGLYREAASGFTYDPQTGLYFDASHQCFYVYSAERGGYEFHAYANEATQLHTATDYPPAPQQLPHTSEPETHAAFEPRAAEQDTRPPAALLAAPHIQDLEAERKRVLQALKQSLLGTASLDGAAGRSKRVRLDPGVASDTDSADVDRGMGAADDTYTDRAELRRKQSAGHREPFEQPSTDEHRGSPATVYRDASVSIGRESVGYRLLEKMRWRAGEPVGRSARQRHFQDASQSSRSDVGSGRVLLEPLLAERRLERVGLGFAGATAAPISGQGQAQELRPGGRATVFYQKLRERYHEAM